MRTENSIKNISVGLIGRIVDLLFAFITRAVFLKFLTTEYLGITGLFTNILSVLNLAELGIGSAIVFALYAPLANEDNEKIKSLMNLYKKVYFCIGLVVLVAGLSLLPFLNYLIKGSTHLVNVKYIFVLYTIQSVTSYWFFAYKSALLDADQKKYIISLISYVVSTLGKVVQIIFLYALKADPTLSFYVYTTLGIAINIVYNCAIARVVDKRYPFIKEKNYSRLTKDEKKGLVKNIYGLTLYKISTTVNSAADNIIISAFMGVSLVGLYSNYTTIVIAVTGILTMFFSPIISSIGNLYVKESKEKTEGFFNILHFASAWMYGFCSICLFVLTNQFIGSVWLGEEYLLSALTLFVISINFLVDGLMNAPITYRSACGLFWESRYRAVIATIVNVVLSILFVTKLNWGIPGVLFATIISRIGVTLWFDPYVIFHKIFNKSPISYYLRYFRDLLLILITGALTYFIVLIIPAQGIIKFVYSICLCIIIPNTIWWCLFHKNVEYQYIKSIVVKTLNRLRTMGKDQEGNL